MRRTNAKLEKHIERLRITLNNKTQTSGHKNRPSSRANKNGLRERAVEDMYQELEELQARLVHNIILYRYDAALSTVFVRKNSLEI